MKRFKNFHHQNDKKCAFTLAEGATHVATSKNSRKVAFTLAEVLITLGVIGVVAAITLSSVIQKKEERTIINKLRKVQTTLSQAYMQIVAEDGGVAVDTWGLGYQNDPATPLIIFNKFKPYLKFAKVCGSAAEGCFPNVNYKNFNGNDTINFITDGGKRYMFVLADGTLAAFHAGRTSDLPWNKSNFINIYVDVNGPHGPNKFGVDTFQLLIDKSSTAARPAGMNVDMSECYGGGYTCAAWVLINDNMDYRHCQGLNWNTKLKCK